MKKVLFVAFMALFTVTANAQLISSHRYVEGNAHNFWVDLGLGAYTGDYKDGGLGLDLGFRWNKMFHEYVGWDIIKVAGQADTKHFKESISIKALTGIRVESPVVFGNSKIYGNFAGGYIYGFDSEKGAFTWEVGAGLKLTPQFNVGIAYDAYSKNSFNTGFINLKLGYAF
ncbi:MAG: outer membrane beta-barrel protein [Prevotella sp.]|nr:outer membrane beta-barrel protein [Prevotella sp.]